MNAYSPASTFTPSISGAEIAAWALACRGTTGAFGGRAGSGTLDCAGHIMAVAAGIGAPITIDALWSRDGTALPLNPITPSAAKLGDIVVFDMAGQPGFGKPGEINRFIAGIITFGDFGAAGAQITGCLSGACKTTYLHAFYAPHAVAAWRFPARAARLILCTGASKVVST